MKMSFKRKYDFFVQFLVSSSSEAKPKRMIVCLQLFKQLEFERCHLFAKFVVNFGVKCSILEKNDVLVLMVLKRTLSHIFDTFGVSTLKSVSRISNKSQCFLSVNQFITFSGENILNFMTG